MKKAALLSVLMAVGMLCLGINVQAEETGLSYEEWLSREEDLREYEESQSDKKSLKGRELQTSKDFQEGRGLEEVKELEEGKESQEDDLWKMLGYGEEGENSGENNPLQEIEAREILDGDAYQGEPAEMQIFRANPGDAGEGTDDVYDNKELRAAIWMVGEADPDGHFYYRGDNCAVRIQLQNYHPGERIFICFDGVDRTNEGQSSLESVETAVWSYSAEQVSSFFAEDGEHRIGVYREGNDGIRELLPFQEHPLEDELVPFYSAGAKLLGGEACLIMDRKPPLCEMTIRAPGAARQNLSKRGSRYYFNSAFEVHFSFSDENLDPARIEVRRGSVITGQYDSEKTEILAFPDVLLCTGQEVADKVGKNGVYRYLVAGCDKAGNPPKSAGGDLREDGRTRHIVVERSLPAGSLTVLGKNGAVYSTTAKGEAELTGNVVTGNEANILMETDVFSTHTPVKMKCVLRSTLNARKKTYRTKKAAYGASLCAELQGRQSFHIDEWVLTDLAGNKRTVKISPDFFLDPEPPQISLDVNEAAGHDGERPIFRGDVRLGLAVEEAGKGAGGTGLKEVVCDLTADGGRTERRILYQGNPGNPDFQWTGETVVSASSYEADLVKASISSSDYAGNISFTEYEFSIDKTPPSLQLAFGEEEPENARYFAVQRKARLEVRDHHFDPGQVFLEGAEQAEAGEWRKDGEGESGAIWVRDILFAEDGQYRLSIRASDLAGNCADGKLVGAAAEDFVIDRTPPVIQLKGKKKAKKRKYWNKERAIEIFVEDENFTDDGEVLVIRDGESVDEVPYQGGNAEVLLAEDGTYVIEGSATDLAGNRTEEALTKPFVIDRAAPELSVLGVDDGSANREDIEITLELFDQNLSNKCFQVTLAKDGNDGQEFLGELLKEEEGFMMKLPPIVEDGLYHLAVKGKDRAGNAVSREISFSENKLGTVFESEQGNVDGKWFHEPVRPSYILHDVDEVTILSCSVSGEEVPYSFSNGRLKLKDELKADGDYSVSIETIDAAGHRSIMEPERIRIDTTPPALAVSGLAQGRKYYFEPIDLVITSDDPDAACEELILDGREISQGDASLYGTGVNIHVATYGEHEIRIRLVDPAGNSTEEMIRKFVITDDPVLRLTGNPLIPLILIMGSGGLILLFLIRKKRKKAEEKMFLTPMLFGIYNIRACSSTRTYFCALTWVNVYNRKRTAGSPP